MKRSYKSILGVTLLEIMLVLAIAAMVIVMSIRYYQSASTNQKINAAIDAVTAIIAGGESYLAATGSLTGYTAGVFATYMPGGNVPNSPWGGPISLGTQGANTYTINIANVPTAACTQLLNLLTGQNTKLTGSACTAIVVTE